MTITEEHRADELIVRAQHVFERPLPTPGPKPESVKTWVKETEAGTIAETDRVTMRWVLDWQDREFGPFIPLPAVLPTKPGERTELTLDVSEPEEGSNNHVEVVAEPEAEPAKPEKKSKGKPIESGVTPETLKEYLKAQEDGKAHWDNIVSRTYWKAGKYYFKHNNGRWGEYPEKDYRTVLEGTKFFAHIFGENATEVKSRRSAYFEELKRHVFENNSVVFVGELAGYKEGVTKWKGEKYLITKGPTIIKPAEGEFPTIYGLLLQTFGEEQLPHFNAWLKVGFESLSNGEKNTGQVLVIAGEPGVGKTCIKELIIRPVLGSRHCDPASFLQGDTRFNSDLSVNEVWEMDDQIGVSDAHRRKTYETAFKKLAANADQRVEGKGTNAIQPPPLLRRLVVCTNDNESDLFVLPPQTESTADKMIVLKAYKAEKPLVKLPTIAERKAFRDKIEAELPAYVNWLMNWEVPAEIQDSRFGVKAYRNPELAEKLDSMSDEARVLEMIDILLFKHANLKEAWEGSYEDLELALRQAAKEAYMSEELRKVLWNRKALQHGLGRLKGPTSTSRVSRKHTEKGNLWTIQPPGWQPELLPATE